MTSKELRAHLAAAGSKGGKKKGKSKARGGSEYYRKLVAKRKRKS